MGKEMTLDVLSSIKGAEASQVVEDLFTVIKQGSVEVSGSQNANLNAVGLEDLRPDEAVLSSETERNLIIENFPNEKDGCLVVPKVIEE